MYGSILGAATDRVRTTVDIPKRIIEQIDEVCAALRIPRNVFLVLAGSMLVIKLIPLIEGRKRSNIVNLIDEDFQTIINNIRKTL